ncbi:hypothetical protein [Nocardiopsis sp. NPDC006938]|uniref:hypothetical protein n=1 Tax=Nocardiopsis sp. NPDC006938 TaxID=3364337 RepID=UPI0036A13201
MPREETTGEGTDRAGAGGETAPEGGTGRTPSGGARARRVARFRRTGTVLGAGALASVLAVVVYLTADGSEEPDATPGGPVARAEVLDRRTLGPVVTDLPSDCGVSEETAALLIPDVRPRIGDRSDSGGVARTCRWSTDVLDTGGGERSRELDVTVRATEDLGEGARSDARAVRDLGTELAASVEGTRGLFATVEALPFAGLGDEAVLVNAVDTEGPVLGNEGGVEYRAGRTTVLFRTVNAVVEVSSAGADPEWESHVDLLHAPEAEPLDTGTTWGGALTAAEEIARGLGQPPQRPFAAVPEGADPHGELPDPCVDLPEDLLRQTGVPAGSEAGEGALFTGEGASGAATGACAWRGGRNLTVEVGLADEGPDGAAAAAAREFAFHYLNARVAPEAETGEEPDQHVFTALSGPAEEAFARHVRGENGWSAEVVLLDGDLVARVRLYDGSASGPMPSANDALDDAFRLAEEVAAQVT